jgi:superfamily II DNA or RNA helicase
VRLEDLKTGLRLSGVVPGETVVVIAANGYGADAVELTFKIASGEPRQQLLFRKDEPRIEIARSATRPFDAPAADFKLAAEAQRIKLAGLFDPMLAVATSDVRPLPHQIRAVYGEMLDKRPLRFLLADDPGAGKTIMAGLYIKELILRDDVHRCLIVAPGGLVEQWQDELFFKFGLNFEIFTNQIVDATVAGNVFDRHPYLIARMDQLARNEDLLAQVQGSEWDLVVVDEAHRMGAHYFGNKLEKTKRYQLGELLGQRTRHLLLMTATPHAGKEEDFQLFLQLLDRDRFAGKFRSGIHDSDVSGVMRRMIKEDLLTFEGTRLFPERIAQTVPYLLTDAELALYDQVTDYVREGMNRADKLDGKRRNSVGFALTVLQRRLASSPEAIYQSLLRRAAKLERHRQDIEAGRSTYDDLSSGAMSSAIDHLDDDEYSAAETEQLEEDLLDSATAARTVVELEAEIAELNVLAAAAKRVRDSAEDRKWVELRRILEDHTLLEADDGTPRKLIIFTEHRDTLNYLAGRIGTLLGRPEAVQQIHGGIRRGLRREITEQFTKNPDCRVLLATDAAGEGLNLQAAHLMVNYDLPWNPNRIEQRFGRVHRIGQTQVCRLWNLVASNTREGAVFERLLEKVDEQRKAYGGKVFDVLGAAFSETPLRDLLIEAIRYGDSAEAKLNMLIVINKQVGDGLVELLQERALAHETLSAAELDVMRAQMDEARARRLQPHYIEGAFREGFKRAGGRLSRREKGRFEITHVPASLRQQRSGAGPIASRYERVTFALETAEIDGAPRADLLAPGHPLHDAVTDRTIESLSQALERGTILVSGATDSPRLLVGVAEEIVDATGADIARRFGYAWVNQKGEISDAGPAPYLDCVAAPATAAVTAAGKAPWLDDAEQSAVGWIIAHQLSEYLDEVQTRRTAELSNVRDKVHSRLSREMNRLAADALAASAKEAAGDKPRQSSESLERRAADLDARLSSRMALLDKQLQIAPKPPRVVTAALVLPLATVDDDIPADAAIHAVETKEVERRGVELALATERRLGRRPEEQAFNNRGFDILSHDAGGDPIRIEVKARLAGAEDFFVTYNEVILGKNAAPRYRLAMVTVDPRGPEYDEIRYLADPFATADLGSLDATGVRLDWPKTWAKGKEAF